MIIDHVCYRLQVSDTFALALVAKSGSAGTKPSAAEQATFCFLFIFAVVVVFFFASLPDDSTISFDLGLFSCVFGH